MKKVADMVAADQNVFGGLGKGFVDPARNNVAETSELERPLGFITVGPPSAPVRAVIDAFRNEVKVAAR